MRDRPKINLWGSSNSSGASMLELCFSQLHDEGVRQINPNSEFKTTDCAD
jgi:hypothetical protein